MSTVDALRNAYFKLYYVPPSPLHIPQDYASVTVTRDPEIIFAEIDTSDPFFGFELLDVSITTEGVGGVVFVFQVTCYVRWEVSFTDVQGQFVRQVHKVFVSMPFVHVITGPKIIVSRLTKWQFKLAQYAVQFIKAYKELREIEDLLAKIVAVKKAIRPEDIKALKERLKALEAQWTNELRSWLSGEVITYAFLMRFGSPGAARLAGTRIA
jgi:hypothetical protein